MSTRIDGNGGHQAPSVRAAVDRAPAKEGADRSKSDGLRRDLVSTFKSAFRLDVTSDVLSEIRDRLVTLRAGLQVSSDSSEKQAFVDSTLGSISQLFAMADFGPVDWPDVPPREVEPGQPMSPLATSLLESLDTRVALPMLAEDDAASPSVDGTDGDAAQATEFVDRAIREIDDVRARVSDARSEVGQQAAGIIGDRMREPDYSGGRFVDPGLAEAAARQMRDRFASDPEAAIRAIGRPDPEAVLTLVA